MDRTRIQLKDVKNTIEANGSVHLWHSFALPRMRMSTSSSTFSVLQYETDVDLEICFSELAREYDRHGPNEYI